MVRKQCKHYNKKHKVVGTPKLTKSQRWQRFTWENVCVGCGEVIKKHDTIAK